MRTSVHCANCGSTLAAESVFCERCGARMICLGRNPESDAVIDGDTVSWNHALLIVYPNQALELVDLQSRNGTSLNQVGNFISRTPVAESDMVYFGTVPRLVGELVETGSRKLAREPERFAFVGNRLVLGRAPEANRRLNHPTVSWMHAVLTRSGDKIYIEDLGSTNGTYVDGRRISGRVPVGPNQEIRLGSFSFRFDPGGKIEERDSAQNVSIDAEGLVVVGRNGAKLLQDISLSIQGGEMVALMGPSGAGKSTLLKALNGMIPAAGGAIYYQGRPLAECINEYRPLIGYCPQDDIMHRLLTVYKALYYTAKLRLPAGSPDADIHQRVKQVLEMVGLWNRRDSPIVTISGGQRRRVNLAMEMLSDPAVMFLDEPTSGLGSTDAEELVGQLRRLADEGKTIVVTIHQPDDVTYSKFNLLAMVSNIPDKEAAPAGRAPGRLIYFGAARDAASFFGAPGTGSPSEFFKKMNSQAADYWARRFEAAGEMQQFLRQRLSQLTKRAVAEKPPRLPKERFRQLLVLMERLAELKIRDHNQLAFMLAAPIIFGLLVVATQNTDSIRDAKEQYLDWVRLVKRVGTTHFLMVVAAFWFGCNNAIREIVGEQVIYLRERMGNLSLTPYIGSKYAVLGVLCLVQNLVMLVIVHLGCSLSADFLTTLGTLWVLSVAGVGMGLLCSALTESNEAAVATLPIVLLPMIVLGGSMTPLHEIRESNKLIGMMADVVAPTRWAFEANLQAEAKERGIRFAGLPPEKAKEQLEKVQKRLAEAEAGQRRLDGRRVAAAGTAAPALTFGPPISSRNRW